MKNENFFYIEGGRDKKLFYRFSPASLISNFVPLIVILSDEKDGASINFEYKMWNVLTPVRNKDGLFDRDLLQELVEEVSQEHECEEHIYFYGSGSGAYDAILHGILSKANAVYADLSCIRGEEGDLTTLLNTTDSFPIFYLCDEAGSGKELEYFAEACKKNAIKCRLDFCPKLQDDESSKIKELLDMLEKMKSAL